MIKRILALVLAVLVFVPFVCACSSAPAEDPNAITLEDLKEWCEASGKVFFEGYLQRDYNKMSSVCSVNFKDEYDSFFAKQDKKVWLTTYYDNYLLGAQAIPSVFTSTKSGNETIVKLEYSIVCADYTSGNRNWLLMYSVAVTFDIDMTNKVAKINNPTVVFDLYKDMCNDYTTHVAAMALGVNDESFDISQYYYDQDLGIYVPYEIPSDEPTETEQIPDESPVVDETVPQETYPEETSQQESEVVNDGTESGNT